MGWEMRHGRRYLYRNRRVNGKPLKQYLAANDCFGFGELMAFDLERVQRLEAECRQLTRQARTDYRRGIDDLLVAVTDANGTLRILAEGLLHSLGYHQHHRGDWRMRRDLENIRTMLDGIKAQHAQPTPLVNYNPPANDAEAVELFAKARAGDAEALARVQQLIRERKWVDWLGDIGRQATRQLICKAAGGDAVWEAGITQKAIALREQLLGEKPTVLEELLVRRVVNGWIATHALELELTLRPPADARNRACLDQALTRTQKRFTDAARELARVRRLQAPRILAQVNVAAEQTVVNATAAVGNLHTTQPKA